MHFKLLNVIEMCNIVFVTGIKFPYLNNMELNLNKWLGQII